MSRVEIFRPGPEHAGELAGDIRQADRAEWVLAGGRPVEVSLRRAVEVASGPLWALRRDGTLLCIWGARPTDRAGAGNVWLAATNAGQRHALAVQRQFRWAVQDLHAAYATLEAWAYSENRLHHHWMERLGFVRTGEERRFGLGARFILFRRTAECASTR